VRTFLQDLRYGARILLKKPGFTLIAALAIALGVGAVTTMFSAADATMLRPFSFVRPAWRTHLEVKVLYEPGRGNR
jgi:putative ABC transport system permease protein